MPYWPIVAESSTSVTPRRVRITLTRPAERAAMSRSDVSLLFVANPQAGRIGGIQRQSRRLYEALGQQFPTQTLADTWRGRGPASRNRRLNRHAVKEPIVYCDAAVSSIIGTTLFGRSTRKIVGTVHGLDIIAPVPAYQRRVRAALRRLDRVVCVSDATAAEVARFGVHPERIAVIHNPAEPYVPAHLGRAKARGQLQSLLGVDLVGRKIILSVGRPVRRKGFDQFIRRVFRDLPEDYVYIVAGPELTEPTWVRLGRPFMSARRRRNLLVATGYYSSHRDLVRLSTHPRVCYLNGVSDAVRDLLYAAADLFVLPNRRVPGDMEGFGIVALEAATREVPVVAFGIEGITDAVIDGRNGYCIADGDYRAMREKILMLLRDPDGLRRFGRSAAAFTADRFAIDRITQKYSDLFIDLAQSQN